MLNNINNVEDVINFALESKKKNKEIDVLDMVDTMFIVNKNKELLILFDKYDRGELKDEDLSFDTSKYINNTIDKEI